MKTVLAETFAAAAISATVTASKPRASNRRVATSEIAWRVSAFLRSRNPFIERKFTSDRPMKVWLITGASSGLGRRAGAGGEDHGDQVVATSRGGDGVGSTSPTTVDRWRGRATRSTPTGASTCSSTTPATGCWARFEELSDPELREVFETNLFGALAVTRAVLPVMRASAPATSCTCPRGRRDEQGPAAPAYAAPKSALEAMSEALAAEVGPLGIKVTIVEPGPFRTDFSGRSLRYREPLAAPTRRCSAPRRPPSQRRRHAAERPYRGAQAIIAAVEAEHPPLRLPLGAEAFGWLAPPDGTRGRAGRAEELGGDTAFSKEGLTPFFR